MSGWQRTLSTCWVVFFLLSWVAQGQGSPRPVLGILPFEVNYPAKNLDWVGYFLQEALTHQVAISRKFAPRSAQAMQLWAKKLPLTPFVKIHPETMAEMAVQQLVRAELQKVIGHASLKGTLFHLRENQPLEAIPFQNTFAWGSPDEVIATLLQTLSQADPAFAQVKPAPQNYQWDSLEAFYRWKLQPRHAVGTVEWQEYKEELAALLSHYPDIARLIYPEMAASFLLEGVQSSQPELLKKAHNALEEAVQLDPKNHQNYALLAQVYYFQNDKNAAKSEAVIANSHNPQDAMAQILYGLTIGQSPEEQQKHILGGFKKNPFLKEFPLFAHRNLPAYETLAPLLSSWTVSPAPTPQKSTYELALEAGKAYFAQKQWKPAQEQFEKAVALQPAQLEPQLYLVRIALAEKKYQGALNTLLALQKQFPEDEQILLHLGLAHERLQSLGEAEEFYRQALFFQSDHPQALLRLGTVLIKKKQYSEAQNYLETLIRHYPDYSVGWWNLGLLHAKQMQWQKAETAIRESLRLDPNNSKIQKVLEEIQAKTK